MTGTKKANIQPNEAMKKILEKPPYTRKPIYAVLEDLFLRAGGKIKYEDPYELMSPALNTKMGEQMILPGVARYLPNIDTIEMPFDVDDICDDHIFPYNDEPTDEDKDLYVAQIFAHEMAHALTHIYIEQKEFVNPQYHLGLNIFGEGIADAFSGALFELARRIAETSKKGAASI